jgi:hypothetical protein
MIRIDPNSLNAEMVRGDTGTFSVRPKINGEYVLKEGDHLWFTVRKIKDKTILLQKDVTEFDDGKAEIIINPSDTANFEIGNYIYDLKMIREDGTVDSLIPGGRDSAYLSIKRGVK